jgi:uncharacterized protein (TIGR00255 family)
MLRSMTGFGAASGGGARGWRVEARSVNHRHLQLKVHVPDELAELEAEIEQLVRQRLERGAVSVSVAHAEPDGQAALEVDETAVTRYRKRFAAIARRHGIPGELTIETLAALPGVLAARAPSRADAEERERTILRCARAALDALVGAREHEGRALAADLLQHARALEKLNARIAKRMPSVVERHQVALRKRVDELLGSRGGAGGAELAREIAVLADRLDVSEEVSRLSSHVEHLEAVVASGGACGRRLDFLVQELLREVNTIGSKCNDAEVTRWVIESKTHVERLREQVQNVE